MTAFSAAIDALFRDPNMGIDAVWRAGGCAAADGVAVRVIRAAPDEVSEFGGARLVRPAVRLDVRVSQVARPVPGDLVDIGTETLAVLSDGVADELGLVWRVGAVEQ